MRAGSKRVAIANCGNKTHGHMASGRFSSSRWTVGAARRRARAFGDGDRGWVVRFDHGVAVMSLDAGLDLDDLVCRHDGEAKGMRPHREVLRARERDELVASDLAA